ncbi:MAG: hypothetical protein UT50_C0030G0003 [Candidatus Moranbacteria bacterium GW2011_GWA2_39_41]|nr:MAG: hypothetical protein UT50_C0030G0003 [Candidatus Moranbacteria bacterium GW2011_GWA2_39_41]
MWNIISQVGIFVFGVSAIFLVARKNKWGFVLGLMAQPFWYVTSIQNKQWGIVLVSVFYTCSWAYGIYEWFWKNKAEDNI